MPGDLQRTLEIDPAIQAVEIKITAQVHNEELVRAALERSGEEPEHRRVFFFDTASLELFDSGGDGAPVLFLHCGLAWSRTTPTTRL